jgi:hypothetical protein
MRKSVYDIKVRQLTIQSRKVLDSMSSVEFLDVNAIIRRYGESYPNKVTQSHVLGVLSGLKTKGLVFETSPRKFKRVDVETDTVPDVEDDAVEEAFGLLGEVFKDAITMPSKEIEELKPIEPIVFADSREAENPVDSVTGTKETRTLGDATLDVLAKKSDALRRCAAEFATIADEIDGCAVQVSSYLDSIKKDLKKIEHFRAMMAED